VTTIEEIDRALADWKARLHRIDDNLMALETDSAYTLLEAQGDALEGVTRDRVVPALSAMRELFGQRGLLDDVLEKATGLRTGLNRMFPGDRLREIDHLLRGPSIALPPVETPLARRGLLDASETTTAITPDQLLGAMMSSFQEARDVVSAVDEAWARLTPESDRARSDVARLAAVAAALGEDTTRQLTAISAQLDAVTARISRDPLGANRALTDDVNARLTTLELELRSLQDRRDQVRADVGRAHTLLADLHSAHIGACSAHARSQGQVKTAAGGPLPCPLDEARIDGLAQWLTTLDATMSEGHWTAAGIGIARWLAAGDQALGEERAIEWANAEPLDRRNDLRGRLGARRQQARAMTARGASFDLQAEEIADRAEAMLDTVPTPVDEAQHLVTDYELRLRAASHRP